MEELVLGVVQGLTEFLPVSSSGHLVIFSNVLVDEHKKPRWEGDGEDIPAFGTNYQGMWTKDMQDVPLSHPNSRCTLLAEAIENHGKDLNADPKGVQVRVITYSGRDSNTMPPMTTMKEIGVMNRLLSQK